LAHALTAGAGAAAAVLIGKQQGMAVAAKAATRKGAKSAGLLGNALQDAFSAAVSVLHDRDLPRRRKEPVPAHRSATANAASGDDGEGDGIEFIERFLVRQYGENITSRLIVAASVRAIAVLIREHPLIAARLLGVGLARAAQVGVADLYDYVNKGEQQDDGRENVSARATPRQSLVPDIDARTDRSSRDD
jgi:hypothetical protein